VVVVRRRHRGPWAGGATVVAHWSEERAAARVAFGEVVVAPRNGQEARKTGSRHRIPGLPKTSDTE